MTNEIVEVAVAEVKGFFLPSDAERAAAYELLVELTTRPSSAQLGAVDVSLDAELSSIEEMFELTRTILRAHGTDASKGSAGNLSLAVVALRVLNEVFRPVVDRWRPRLDDHLATRPDGRDRPSVTEWERRWELAPQCRAELNAARSSTRAYVETLSHIAGTPAIADAVLSAPSSTMIPHERITESRHPGGDVRPRRKMVSWLDPVEMFATWRSTVRGERSVKRFEQRPGVPEVETDGRPRPTATFEAQPKQEFWFDYVCDMGDAFDGTAPVAWLVGRRSLSGGLRLPDRLAHEIPTPPATMPQGELLVFGGDQIYPYAARGFYESQTELPYRMGLEGNPSGSDDVGPTLVSIPANHDWMGGIEHYRDMFVSKRRFADHWSTVQENNWFRVSLPQGWWIWGIDTGLHDRLVGPQEAYFREAADLLLPGDRVILVTPVPLWQLRQKRPDDYAALRAVIDPLVANAEATMPLCVSGDSHLFAHMERVDVDHDEDHITAGGGGAFLQPTHNLAERIPLEQGNAEFRLTSRWPLSADSRSLAPGVGKYLGRQFWPLMIVAGLLQLALTGLSAIDRGRWVFEIDDPAAPDGADPIPVTSPDDLGWTDAIRWTLWSPWVLLLVVAVTFAGTLAFRGNSIEPKLSKAARAYGLAAGATLAAVFTVVEAARTYVAPPLPEWPSRAVAAVVGGVLGILAFMSVVRWSNRRIKANDTFTFSPAQSTRFKHFLRFRIDQQGDLTCYCVGVDPVGEGWFEAMTPASGATSSVPPHDPAGAPKLHYVWGKTYRKFRPAPLQIAVSSSEPDRTAPSAGLATAIEQLSIALIDGGHALLYGGLPDAGLTAELHRIEVARHANNPNAHRHLVNYVAPMYAEGSVTERSEIRRVDVMREPSPGETPKARAIADLTAMRRLMTHDADVRIVIGGAVEPTEPDMRRAPGILEEAHLALEAGLPLFVIGGFGGAAGLIADALLGKVERMRLQALTPLFANGELGLDAPPPEFVEMLTRFRSIGELQNGLTNGENVELLRSRDPATITTLVLRGIHRSALRG